MTNVHEELNRRKRAEALADTIEGVHRLRLTQEDTEESVLDLAKRMKYGDWELIGQMAEFTKPPSHETITLAIGMLQEREERRKKVMEVALV